MKNVALVLGLVIVLAIAGVVSYKMMPEKPGRTSAKSQTAKAAEPDKPAVPAASAAPVDNQKFPPLAADKLAGTEFDMKAYKLIFEANGVLHGDVNGKIVPGTYKVEGNKVTISSPAFMGKTFEMEVKDKSLFMNGSELPRLK